MATTELPKTTTDRLPAAARESTPSQATRPRSRKPASPWQLAMKAISSLRLTVVLLVMLTFLVLVGTLAQANHDVWYVVEEAYFRVWIAKVELQTFATLVGVFVKSNLEFSGAFYFPGGLTIGLLMVVNLLAAHAFRFKVASRGVRLVLGLILLAIGIGAASIVATAALSAGEQSSISGQFADTLWGLLRAGFALLTLGGAYGLTLLWGRIRRPEWILLAGFNAILLVLACLLFVFPDWKVDDAGMRIVWQMAQAMLAVAVVAAGCWLLFAKRSGVVLLHVGILVLMGHEFYTYMEAVEARMNIAEGETVNYTYEPRRREIALIDKSHPEYDLVTVIPESIIRQAANSTSRTISHPSLPVDIRVAEYGRNSTIDRATDADAARVTTGAGKHYVYKPEKPVSGVGAKQGIDVPYAYLELLDQRSGNVLEKVAVTLRTEHLLKPHPDLLRFEEQPIEIDGNPYTISMRFRREIKPYSITLDDFRFDRYVGTNEAKSYSSDVRLVDHELGSNINFKISMNNPLRYRGETFYQSGFDEETEQTTILQVVKNEGWMLPYLGCALVIVGMGVHFIFAISRFASRRAREVAKLTPTNRANFTWGEWLLSPGVWVPAAALLVAVGYLGRSAVPPTDKPGQFAYSDFGSLPIVHQGRMKPIDTVARNLLQSMCQRQEAATRIKGKSQDKYEDKNGVQGKENVPAIRWLLDVVSRKEGWDNYYVYRIDNLELLDSMGLSRRQGFYRYTHDEVQTGFEKIRSTIEGLDTKDADNWSQFQRAAAEIRDKYMMVELLAFSFQPPRFSEGTELDAERLVNAFSVAPQILRDARIPRSLVPDTPGAPWMSPFEAGLRQQSMIVKHALGDQFQSAPPMLQQAINVFATGELPSSIVPFHNAIVAYRQNDITEFNKSLREYRQLVSGYEAELHLPENAEYLAGMKAVERLDSERVTFENKFNAVSPFYYTAVLYFLALILSATAWLIFPQALGRSATALLLLTLVIHTLAIAARIYISGKPPITNIYTTLVFVGWFAVVAMLILEAIFRVGIGNFVASVIGFTTMQIAHYLGMDGDTFTVLQAVLDTQFWLATHVISINVGYGATILAGAIGIAYLLRVNLLQLADKQEEQKLGKMLYGTICFALLFSFFGTVLGGLWADDSWGRFWGWDPKENGAMMIVLWNAVILHARWGGMVATRGAALLSIIGNIITAWSWFGVNQLGEGMHSYGFSEELARYLLIFVVSQFAILAVGLATLPWSGRALPAKKQA